MKNLLLILVLILTTLGVQADIRRYYTTTPRSNYYYRNNYYRPTYNPYYNYSTTNYRFKKLSSSDRKKIRKIRTINRIRRNVRNYLTWDILRNAKGALTGYSTPINQDVYQQLGVDVNNSNQKKLSPNTTMDLYSMPSNNNSRYSSKGKKDNDLGGVAGRTGVKIIYD